MKKIMLIGLIWMNCLSFSLAQQYCENFEIVSIFDFPPSPITPGGNYFLLLLSVHEDNPNISTGYANLFFVDNIGDTISIPTGPSSHLPLYSSDTIPYILKLNAMTNNQDFPPSFEGQLIIINPAHEDCEIFYSKLVSNLKPTDISEVKFDIFPNPFHSLIKIDTEKQIDKMFIFNTSGAMVGQYSLLYDSNELDLHYLNRGGYYFVVQFEDGETRLVHVLKM